MSSYTVDDDLAEVAKELESWEPPPPRAVKRTRSYALMIGIACVVAALTVLPYVAAFPAGILLLDVGMLAGLAAWLRRLGPRLPPALATAGFLVPLMAVPNLINAVAIQSGAIPPLGLRVSIAFHIIVAAAGAGLLAWAPRRDGRLPAQWIAGAWAIPVSLLVVLGFTASGAPPGSLLTFWSTLGAVATVLAAQACFRWSSPRWRRLSTPAALALAATQLLDGFVSWLRVSNPFGWLAVPSREQVPLSAFLIEWTGPGYVVVKWSIAALLALVAHGAAGKRLEDPVHIVLLYLAVGYIGAGPAIFSTAHLLR